MILPIVGAKYRKPADTILANLPDGSELFLEREPENTFDSNAVMVCLPIGWMDKVPEADLQAIRESVESAGDPWPVDGGPLHVGYIPKGLAADMAAEWDSADDAGERRWGTLTRELNGNPAFAPNEAIGDDEDDEHLDPDETESSLDEPFIDEDAGSDR
jgi:hypothetical protein